MAKSKAQKLKSEILSDLPHFKIKRDRLKDEKNRDYTMAYLLTPAGNVILERRGNDFEGALKNLKFAIVQGALKKDR